MINQFTAEKACQIAGNLTDQTKLGYRKDTPLATLVENSHLEDTTFQPKGGNIVDATNIDTDGVVLHSVLLAKESDKIRDAVLPLLHLVRNQVIPGCQSVLEQIQETMANQAADTSTTLGYTLEYVPRDKLLLHGSIREEVAKYAEVVRGNFSGFMVLIPTFSADIVRAACKTNSKEVQALVEGLIDTHLEDLEQLFTHKGHYDALPQSALVIAYLVCNYIYDSPATGINRSLEDYNRGVYDLREQLGRRIYGAQQQYLADVEVGLLYAASTTPNVICVYSEVMQRHAGAITPEMLFANERLGRPQVKDVRVLEQADYLNRVFATESKLAAQAFDNALNDHMRNVLRSSLTGLIVDVRDQHGLPGDFDVIIDRMRNAVRKLHHDDIADIACTVRDLVCALLYPHTGALDLIRTNDHIAAENPDMDPRDSFALATVDYITRWVVSAVTD